MTSGYGGEIDHASCRIRVRHIYVQSLVCVIPVYLRRELRRVLRASKSSPGIQSRGSGIPSTDELPPEVQRSAASRPRRNSGSGGFGPAGWTRRAVIGDDRTRRNARYRVYPRVQIVQIRDHEIPRGRSQPTSASYGRKGSERRSCKGIRNENGEGSDGESRAFGEFGRNQVFHGLLFYAVDRRHVLWPGFVSSGGGRHVSTVPSVCEPRVVRASCNAYAMAENPRIY